MQPNKDFIKIPSSKAQVEKFISEVMLIPRCKIIEWSQITKQSPGLKIGYPAQHLASLLTGVEGSRTAARGDDLADGSEVKGCNRIAAHVKLVVASFMQPPALNPLPFRPF